MLLPSLVLLGIFVYGFIGQTFWVSLTNWGKDPLQALALEPQLEFIGFENYRQLFTAPSEARFRQDLVNTFFFTLFFLAGCLGLGLGLAVLLEQNVRGEGLFRTVFLFPMALAFIVTGTIWRWLLQPQGGLNVLPTLVGLPPGDFRWLASRTQVWQFNWQDLPFFTGLLVSLIFALLFVRALRRGDRTRTLAFGVITLGLVAWTFTGARRTVILPFPETHGFNLAFIGIILAAVWQMSGYTMALYLAGLRGIPDELREAARSDGASEWQLYRHVILPLLAPITLSAMIILGHISLKIFDLVFAMAGADNATTDVPALLMYLRAFRANQFAEGAAIAIVLLILVAAVIIPYLYSSLKTEVRR
ncbi:sugar ABC transporter permease [Truepera radiovictrix]|nr:sugar ABC transporter permease [Truepera radiovictrix]WMT58002.1 sugar ABC transporter permease [Truepera radiovictrix]